MAKPTILTESGQEGISIGSTGSLYVEKDPISHGIIKTSEKPQYGGSGFGSTGSNFIEKEKTQHGIVKTEEKAQHGGSGFGSTGSIAVEKEKTQHGIVKSEERAQHQGAGFATMGSIATEKEKTGHGIVRSEEKAQHQGAGFGTMGSIATEKEKTGHGIVRSEERAQHQGAGFATMGSLATEKEATGHGIIAPGAKIKEGPADERSDAMIEGIKVRQETKYDSSRADKAKKWLEDVLKETFTEENLQEALKSGVRLCNALNLVYPGSIPKINTKDTVYMQRENLDKYVKACARLGFNKSLLFDVPDLYDGKNMTKVVENIYELAHFGSRKSGLPKLEDEPASS
jgi:hypothetical protein